MAGLRARERTLGDRCAAAEARAEEAGMLRRAAEARARELEEEAERREAAQADGEIRLQRLRAEKKVLLAEIRRGAGGGASGGGGTASGSMVGGGMGGRDRGGEVVGDDVLGDSGSEAAGGAVGVDIGRKGVRSPRGSGESVLDKKVGCFFFVVVSGWITLLFRDVRENLGLWTKAFGLSCSAGLQDIVNGIRFLSQRGIVLEMLLFIVSPSGLSSVRI